MPSLKSRVLAAAAAVAITCGRVGLAAAGAQASSLSCTSKTSCGGATLAYTLKGFLALSVLAPDPNTNGGFGYWNEPVGFATEDYPNGSGLQDFTVAQVRSEIPVPGVGKGGTFGLGEYAVIYTPGGKIPDDPALTGKTTGTQQAFCVSVQDLYRLVRGHRVQRWPTVLRPCDTFFGGPLQESPPVFSFDGPVPVVTNANPYQLWAPTQVSNGGHAYLEFQNIGLDNSSFYRHGYAGENFVLDDTGFGGTGTQGLAFQENDGLNQDFTIIGCTPPITTFNTVYYNCPSGPVV